MKKYKFLKKTINVKSESLEKMIDACISLPEPTRATVSQYASVSLVTAGKLLTALDECRFSQTVYKYTDSGRSIKIHKINDKLTATVIDLSSPYCSVSVIRGDGSIIFYQKYDYPTGVSMKEGVLAALSRVCLEIKSLDLPVSAICTILADEEDGAAASSVLRPRDKDWLESIIGKLFGITPTAQLTLCEALTSAAKFCRLPTAQNKSMAYIHTGGDVKLYVLPKNNSPVICRPCDLMISDRMTLSDALEEMNSPSSFAKLLARVVNLAHSAFSPQEYVIEYDSAKFGGKALHEINKSFALLAREAPVIYSRDHRSSVTHLGAAAKATSEFIKLYITTTCKQKTSEDS